MIFATVGTQLPFPRLIKVLNTIAIELDEEIIAQTGPYDGPADNITVEANLTPATFEDHFTRARVIVAHAGIGTILSAKRYRKPLILFPRLLRFGEHRNDHQLATARQVNDVRGVHVAMDIGYIAALLRRPNLEAADEEASPARENLIETLRQLIAD